MAIRVEDIDLDRDRRLVEAWQGGDASAFDELYRLYFDRLRGYCRRRIHDPAEADDLAQEAFIRALRALPTLSGERRFYPWMTVIAGRLCIDHHRKCGRVEPTADIDLGSVDDGHDARFALQADLDHLDQALGRLGPRHAEVLQLREGRGLTYDQIAGELGVPHSTVEALLFRARRALRREFQALSAERLAALPGIGWLVGRTLRLRDRLAHSGADLGAIGGTIAAGAMTAALVAIPSSSPAASDVVSVAPRRAAVTALPAPPPTIAPASAPAPAVEAPAPRPTRTAAVRAMTAEEAEREAEAMPIHLDVLDEAGAGLDPSPILARLLRSDP